MAPSRTLASVLLATTAALSLAAATAQAQTPAGPTTVETHLAAAKQAAGFDYTGTLARLCVAPQTAPGPDRAPGPPPPREAWATEPAKVFDNLYFVGSKIHSAWALTSSEGIILIDTLYDYASEEQIAERLAQARARSGECEIHPDQPRPRRPCRRRALDAAEIQVAHRDGREGLGAGGGIGAPLSRTASRRATWSPRTARRSRSATPP